jgi:hypothetical protein
MIGQVGIVQGFIRFHDHDGSGYDRVLHDSFDQYGTDPVEHRAGAEVDVGTSEAFGKLRMMLVDVQAVFSDTLAGAPVELTT